MEEDEVIDILGWVGRSSWTSDFEIPRRKTPATPGLEEGAKITIELRTARCSQVPGSVGGGRPENRKTTEGQDRWKGPDSTGGKAEP
jgi:hypothetical protein